MLSVCLAVPAKTAPILCYLFDVLMQIYLDNGYSKREAVRSILENNLFGLDIDKRAAQFAYFSVMMKAREYDSNFFSRSHIPQPRVYDIQESNWMGGAYKHEMGSFLNSQEHRDTLNYLLDAFVDAKEYGSILQIKPLDYEGLKEAWETSAAATASNVNMAMWYDAVKDSVAQLIEQAIMLSQKYDAVVTNPPYMGSSGMGAPLANFVKKYYPDSKSDLFAVFIEVCSHMAAEKRYQAMITQHAWMFLSSYEKLREKMMLTETVNMAHLGARAFEEIGGEVVQTTSFVRCRTHIDGYKGTYCRLIEPTSQQGKEDMFLSGENRYFAEQDNFARIPGNPMAYWLSSKFIALLSAPKSIGKTYQSGSGLSTADNERFLRFFWEVEDNKIANFKEDEKKWFLFNKGGEYRKWYGNLQYVVNWENDGEEIKYWVTHNPKDPNTTSWSRRIFNTNLYFLSGVTWSVISSGKISFRAIDTNAMISNAAGGVFGFKNAKERNAFMAAVNSTIWTKIFATINPTLNYFLQFCKPFTKTPDTLGDGCCTEKENEADELSYQQDKELIPSLAAGSVDAAAEDVEHQRSNHIAGQREQPLRHQSQKRHKERNREKNNFLQDRHHIRHFLSVRSYYKGIDYCTARMSSIICTPAVLQLREFS